MTNNPQDYSAASHPGLTRDNNEDCFLSEPEDGLWVVADGMGGHEAGEVASAIVRDTMKQHLSGDKRLTLAESIQAAHTQILHSAANGIGALGMGSTVVALQSQGNKYQIAWVGDSRAYLWTLSADGGHLEQLSIDHSYVQMLVNTGAISAEDAESHPDKNIITQCLGMQELTQVKVDTIEQSWHRNQWILLCSDGLTDEVNDRTIAQILSNSHNCLVAVDQLLHAALTSGGRDNITLQIIESPLQESSRLKELAQWVPHFTGRKSLDTGIFIGVLISLLTLLYFVSTQ
jgi:PPM family protein phosphatase